MSGVLLTAIMGMAAFGIDVGKIFTDRRKAQGTADLAAIAAVTDLPNAARAAQATVLQNEFGTGTQVQVQLGTYKPDAAVAPANRFQPASLAVANSARVTLQTRTELLFARMLVGRSHYEVVTRATAVRSAYASFAIGSRLAKVEAGLLNQLLGGLLGSGLSLSVMDYQALIAMRVDLFDFMNALAKRLHVTGVSYEALLKTNVKASDILGAMIDVERAARGPSGAGIKALSSILNSLNGQTGKFQAEPLIDPGPYRMLPLGEKPKLSLAVAAFDFLTATGQLANGQRQVEVGLGLNVPGIANASLRLAIGERPRGTSWVTIGSEGAKVHTAQTRLLLLVQLVGLGPAPIVMLPLYLELASATAEATSVRCSFPNGQNSSLTLAVTPAAVDAWIADVSSTEFNNFRSAPNPRPAQLVSTAALKVSGRAHVTVTNLKPTPVTFGMTDIAQQTKRTVGTKDFVASLLTKLIGDLELEASVLGLGIGLPGAATGLVAGIVRDAAGPIDQVLNITLQSLGIGVGQADVWSTGIRCDGAVLVN